VDGESNLYEVKSTGVVFKVKPVSVFLLDSIQRKLPRPEVPKQEVEGKDGKKRIEENPAHPAYEAAMEAYQRESARTVEDALLTLGTSVASLPDGFEGPDGCAWVEELAFLGVVPPEERRARYLFWLYNWALKSGQDLVELTKAVRDATLTPESKVVEAAESFRSGA
jgi:hypothetical protein